jgi:hypothetical protein
MKRDEASRCDEEGVDWTGGVMGRHPGAAPQQAARSPGLRRLGRSGMVKRSREVLLRASGPRTQRAVAVQRQCLTRETQESERKGTSVSIPVNILVSFHVCQICG